MNIAIVGLGLIGGSLALAASQHTAHNIIGIDRNAAVLQSALECGAIDEIGGSESLSRADLTIICLYPEATVSFAKENAELFKKNSIVTDVCGIKTQICRELEPIAEAHGFTFIGGHPMAGKEAFGFANAQASLFEGASYIFTPSENAPEAAKKLLADFVTELRFGRVVITTPQEHDRIIAYTSQIPHALACAYVLMPECRRQSGFSAGSFKDVSRVANINETLWTELFLANKENLCEEIGALTENLEKIKNAVLGGDSAEIRRLLKEGRLAKEESGR